MCEERLVGESGVIRYPVGIQTFSEIREGHYVYVDKTVYVHKLSQEGKYYFLSRPRRFGKSLLLSTIEAYYQGRRDLFKGLALDSLTDDWEPHPVFHLDLNTRNYHEHASLIKELIRHLEKWEKLYGDEKKDRDVEERFSHVIERAYEITGKKVVILIDEYDKPMLSAIHNEKLADSFRDTLKAFYGNLKSMDRYIEFAMLTGVARFSKISIFSDLNNLRDITFDNDYSAICGITNEELDRHFQAGIESLALTYGISREAVRKQLKSRYDGYHFSMSLVDVYNPFSLIYVFASKSFDNYWFQSGTPTFLVHILEKQGMPLRKISRYCIDKQTLASAGIMAEDSIVSLYQSGYITIADVNIENNELILDYPNREVRESFLKFLVPYYTNVKESESAFVINSFLHEVNEGNAEELMRRLASLVARVPYGGKGSVPEDHFQNAIYLVFTLMGYRAHVEQRMSRGRIDMTVETDRYVYIFEFKVDASASEAMEQIHERGYWKGFEASGKEITLIAANFDSLSGTLNDVEIQRL